MFDLLFSILRYIGFLHESVCIYILKMLIRYDNIAAHLSALYQINMLCCFLLHIYLEIKQIDGLIMVPTD